MRALMRASIHQRAMMRKLVSKISNIFYEIWHKLYLIRQEPTLQHINKNSSHRDSRGQSRVVGHLKMEQYCGNLGGYLSKEVEIKFTHHRYLHYRVLYLGVATKCLRANIALLKCHPTAMALKLDSIMVKLTCPSAIFKPKSYCLRCFFTPPTSLHTHTHTEQQHMYCNNKKLRCATLPSSASATKQ